MGSELIERWREAKRERQMIGLPDGEYVMMHPETFMAMKAGLTHDEVLELSLPLLNGEDPRLDEMLVVQSRRIPLGEVRVLDAAEFAVIERQQISDSIRGIPGYNAER